MFEATSRYARIETTSIAVGDRTIAYKRRRLLPHGADLPLLADVTFVEGDRLDLLSARTIGDPEQFWRVCDANDAMNPADLGVPGRKLRVALPQP
jgi:hypothetical protein